MVNNYPYALTNVDNNPAYARAREEAEAYRTERVQSAAQKREARVTQKRNAKV